MKNILKCLIIGALYCSTTVVAAPKIWNGSMDISWYEKSAQAFNLTTAEELAGLAFLVNRGESFQGKTITLGADIFLNDTTGAGKDSWNTTGKRTWTPIGTENHPFDGEFDGVAGKNNRKIYGLYINSPSSNYVGLFGYIGMARISNLDVVVGSVSAKDNVGSVVGFAEGGSVINVHAEVEVSGNNRVGGLVGSSTGHISTSSVKENVLGQDSVGGIVGYSMGYVYGTAKNNAFFEGNVKGRLYVGGLAGIGATISNSYTKGIIKGDSNYVGGIVGFLTNSLDSTYHVGGDVIGSNYVGGLVGLFVKFMKPGVSSFKMLKNSYAVGDVKGNNFVGGLIGTDSVSFDNVYACNQYNITEKVVQSSYSEGNIEGNMYVGGVIGKSNSNRNDCSSCVDSIFYVNTYHKNGNVIGKSDYVGGVVGYVCGSIDSSFHMHGDVRGSDYVGGIAGCIYGTIDSSYHTQGDVSGSDYVGGIAGYIYGTIDSSYHAQGDVSGSSFIGGLAGQINFSVMNSHSEGNVSGTGDYVGGLIGKIFDKGNDSSFAIAALQNSYAVGDVKGNDFVGGLIGLDSVYRYEGRSSSLRRVIQRSHSQGRVEGNMYIGGVVGKSYNRNSFYVNTYHKNGNVIGKSDYVGGVAGYFYGSIDSSYHIQGDVSGGDYVGGVAGYVYGSIDSSYHIQGDVSGGDYVGGVVGYVYESIESSYHTQGDVNGFNFVGGLAGQINLSVINSYSEGNVIGEGDYVGGLVGLGLRKLSAMETMMDTTYIRDSYSVGNVEGKRYVGGLVGADSLYAICQRCKRILSYGVNRFLIRNTSKGNVIGKSFVGGLVGAQTLGSDSLWFFSNMKFNTQICNHSDGNVVADSDYVGGLIGYTRGFVNFAHHTGELVNGRDYVGGLAGYAHKQIQNSFAKTFVIGKNYVGGLAGRAQDSINASYFEGDSVTGIFHVGGLVGYASYVVNGSYSMANVEGDDNVGGLIGSANGNISNSYAIGNVVGDVDHSSAGNDNLGGLVGYQYNGSISKSFALGNVSGTTKLGGLVGRFNGNNIFQSYANGDVSGNYYGDPADGVGNYYIGGLVGYAKGALEETYASGVVSGIKNEPVYTGCIVGYVNGSLSVSKSYYDKSKCGLGVDGGENTASVSGIPGKTTTEMQTQSTFEDWDFVESWGIDDKTYPFLRMYANSDVNAVVSTESLDGFVYDGLPKTPLVTTVMFGDVVLVNDVDYTVEYKDNVNVGVATIVVTLKGGYSGSITKTFVIEKATPLIGEMPKSGDVALGQSLTDSELSGGIASVEGKFTWKEPMIKPDLENDGYVVVFVPKDTANYKSLEMVLPINVLDVVLVTVYVGNVLVDSTTQIRDFNYALPKVPDSSGYDFVGFYKGTSLVGKSGDKITVSENMVIEAKYQVQSFVITFINDTTILQSSDVAYGMNPKYTGKTPVKNATTQYSYVFRDWNPAIVKVTEAANYMAVFDSVVNQYLITFKYGSVVLQKDSLAYGVIPDAPSVSLPKNTVKYTYSFKGWDKSVVAVTGNATYSAVIDSMVNRYKVVFMNGNTQLQISDVAYGETPKYTGNTPTKKSSKTYSYKFKEWSPKIVMVTKAATYTAVFDSTKLTGIIENRFADLGVSVKTAARVIQIYAAPIGSVYAITDLRGRVLKKGRVESANFNIAMPQAGVYMVRIGSQSRKVNLR